ncbi:MAG: flagellar hook protein FlgE [Archangiaceae bacterium]|nr:flagellar hook protein FlgE [Archangiaceae bacterium]
MSLLTSLYTGTTGMQANSLDLAVIGDNIANANTIGFKSGRTAFEDMMATSLIGNSGQLGLGANVQTIQKLITQGALTTTGLATDLALQGNGMFVVKGNHNGTDGQFYTRAGQFTVDKDGYLVNLEGMRVQGYPASATGTVQAGLNDLLVGKASSAPLATTTITLQANLDARTAVNATPFDPANPKATSDFASSTTVYDSLGVAHTVDIYYKKTAAGGWDWHAETDGGGVQGGTANIPTEIGAGTLTFDASGNLTASTQAAAPVFNPIGAVQPQALTFDFGTGTSGVTQFGSTNTNAFISQNGYGAGTLSNINIDEKGNVVGAFSNGQTRTLGEVAVAKFESPDQLERAGGNLFNAMPGAGEPNIGAAATGGRGAIVAGALEQSNVDLATEFVRMIAAQRGFQANSKTISTADQLLAELMTLKR